MVARINTGKSINKALNYNEKKVQQGEAECLHAQNFLKDASDLNFYDKLKTFEKLTTLNERTQTNTVHISLNFDPSEKLSNEKLVAIANSYMEKIGFKEQPYVIYRHHDTSHPHIHIVTTNIQRDGIRISVHNMGRNESEAARKAIEQEYKLVKAESKAQENSEKLMPLHAQKIKPGKQSTKAAISNVLRVVIPQYKYSSLAELNAVLKLYNIRADRCGEDSQTYMHNGLLYRVLDEHGNPIGTPIKASRFYMKPTLKNLEQRFEENTTRKQPHAQHVKTTIDYVFRKTSGISLARLETELKKEGISLVLRQNKDGVIYGMTYVDHKSKTVFNGSDLGKQYSAKAMLERCQKQDEKERPYPPAEKKKNQRPEILRPGSSTRPDRVSYTAPFIETGAGVLDALMKPELTGDGVPYPLKKTKSKRKKKKLRM